MIEMKVMKNRKEWLGKRSKYIGGSDCACILGLNPYKSNVDLYLEKIGEKQPQDISDKPQVKFGIMSIDFQKAYENDMAVIDEKGNTEYVDDVENEEQSVVDAEYKEVKEEHPAENSAAAALFGGI